VASTVSVRIERRMKWSLELGLGHQGVTSLDW
jgi:hypothetical protein